MRFSSLFSSLLFLSSPCLSPSCPRSRRFHRLSPEQNSFKKGLNSLKLPILPPKNLVISNKKCKFALNISTNNI